MITDKADAPIGVFDSGLGGLSILAHLYQRLPNEQYLYFADTLHVPYGTREADDIRDLTLQAVDWLVAQGCKLLVIACNTASAHGLEQARARYPQIPIVGLVPALKPAVLHSKTKQVAVLATLATLHGALLNTVIEQIAIPNQVAVHKYSLASLVPWVELDMPNTHPAVSELDELLHTLLALNVDYLVLGCTHYPFFKGYLTHKLAQLPDKPKHFELQLIDSGQAIARRVQSLLADKNLLNTHADPTSPLQFFTTACVDNTRPIASRLLAQFLPTLPTAFFTITADSR